MKLSALVLCRDPESLRVLRRTLEDAGIAAEVCTGPDPAIEKLAKAKFHAILVDCDDMHGSKPVLKLVREAPSNRTAIVFAIINALTSVREAFDLGANFVLDKPLTLERVSRSLRAAQGLILRERRRYFRHKVGLSVRVRLPGGQEVEARASDLSEGGISLRLSQPAAGGGAVRLRFQLPGSKQAIEAAGDVSWTAPGGDRIGVRFRQVPAAAQKEMEQWLSARLEAMQPTGVFINASRSPGKP